MASHIVVNNALLALVLLNLLVLLIEIPTEDSSMLAYCMHTLYTDMFYISFFCYVNTFYIHSISDHSIVEHESLYLFIESNQDIMAACNLSVWCERELPVPPLMDIV